MNSSRASISTEAARSDLGDVSGRDRLVRNVLTSWLTQMVFVVAGFVMPRLIDHRLGQEVLGLWDLGWTLIAYFSLVQLGVVGSVNRYVAMHYARNDISGLNRCASSVFWVLLVMAAIIGLLSVGTAVALPRLMPERVGEHGADMTWVVLGLGGASAIQTASSVYAGVLTGCHRWGIHNGAHAAGYTLTVLGMVAVLLGGGGIRGLALVQFLGELLPTATRVFFAYRVCPGLRLSLRQADWKTARAMMQFGGKSFVPQVAELILHQTVNVLIVGYLGPAALALFARPHSLVMQSRIFVLKMSAVLVPSVSSLQALGEQGRIQELVVKSARYTAFLILPVTTFLVVCGGPLLGLWMGPRYADDWVVAVLALGYTGVTLQLPVLGILGGMNQHGRLAIANLVGSLVAAVGAVVVLGGLKLGLLAVAVAVAGPLLAVNVFYAPVHICHRTGLPIGRYLKEALLFPLLCILPFAVCLLAARWLFGKQPVLALLGGGAVGGAVLLPIYWRSVLPESLKASVPWLSARRKKPTAAAAGWVA
ncbi:MAG: lipopolysaccharide biosynthesis protein [Verrucomicrobia bacterium]|nr:lipopolysaccharide biosynthesis protein [Verrucomicrobiota bacterium]